MFFPYVTKDIRLLLLVPTILFVALSSGLTLAPKLAHASPASTKVNAQNLLSDLEVRAEVKRPRYKRAYFKHWTSSGGCTTRQRVLFRQDRSSKQGGCRARFGNWFSPFDGRTITAASQLDIDHFVPLAEAWRSGAAQGWDSATRKRFANDTEYGYSLIAVSAASNRSKGDKDPAKWLPTNRAYRCQYTARWVAIKHRWKLTIDRAEKRALKREMRKCSKTKLMVQKPMPASIVLSSNPLADPPKGGYEQGVGGGSTKPPGGSKPANGSQKTDPRYKTCKDAKAAGFGPYFQGKDPEYYWYIDRDKDGIACE